MTVLRVALPVPLPQLFDYLPPARGQAQVGSRVLVPFGRGRKVGIVVALAADSELPATRLRPAWVVLDDAPLLDAELMATLARTADYWLGAPGEVYAQALPLALRQDRAVPDTEPACWRLTAAGQSALATDSRRGGSRALLRALADGPADAAQLDAVLADWRPALRRLLQAGLLVRDQSSPDADGPSAPGESAPTLSAEQQDAVDAIDAATGGFQPFLLDGVTGSGKTEVYLALIERALARGGQVLMLVPEIGLAPQTLRRLRARLGVPVEVLHSNLAEGARAKAWLRA